jgi:hypothetical protein
VTVSSYGEQFLSTTDSFFFSQVTYLNYSQSDEKAVVDIQGQVEQIMMRQIESWRERQVTRWNR